MSNAVDHFTVGSLYSNEEIYSSLAVGNAGGLRVKADRTKKVEHLVMMTSVPSARQLSENPYADRIEGDTLIYTGAGREGDQAISGANSRIVEQANVAFPIFGFMLMGSRRDPRFTAKRWAFLGLLEYLRCYQELQLDAAGKRRSAWVFELRVIADPSVVRVSEAKHLMADLLSTRLPDLSQEREVVGVQPSENNVIGETDSTALETVRRRLLSYAPREFEFLLRDLLVRSGFREVEVTRFSQDGGIDLNAVPGENCWPIRSLLVQLQAKRWLHTVGRKEVAELRGSLQPHAAGCIVTTSHYSRAALTEAAAPGKVPINLVDGYALAGLVSSLGLKLN